MVQITSKGLLIEIETQSQHEYLNLLSSSLLQLLQDNYERYHKGFDPRCAVFDLLQHLLPDMKQLQDGMKEVSSAR
jgi:hypothetical protein